MQEYWVNVYEYKSIKDIQFYSHCIQCKEQCELYAAGRTNGKCVYRIHVKMKPKRSYKDLIKKYDLDYSKKYHWMD